MSTSVEKKDDLEIVSPSGIDIVIAGENFNVKPFVLGNRIKVIRLLSSVFLECAKVPGFSGVNDFGAITTIIEIAGDRLVDIYEIVLCKDKEWLNKNVTLKDEVAVIDAILRVNDIPFLLRQIQKMTSKNQ